MYASEGPVNTPEPRLPDTGIQGFWDGVFAGFEAESIETDYWARSARTELDIYDQVYIRIGEILGPEELDQRLRDSVGERRLARHGRGTAWQRSLMDIAAQVGAENPKIYGDLPLTRDAVIDRATEQMRGEYEDAIESLDMTGTLPGLAGFLGRGGAAISDPVSIGLMFVGSPAASIPRVMAREAVLGGIGEALILPRMYEQAERLDIQDPNAALQIAMGAGFAGLLGGAIAGGLTALERGAIYSRERVQSDAVAPSEPAIAPTPPDTPTPPTRPPEPPAERVMPDTDAQLVRSIRDAARVQEQQFLRDFPELAEELAGARVTPLEPDVQARVDEIGVLRRAAEQQPVSDARFEPVAATSDTARFLDAVIARRTAVNDFLDETALRDIMSPADVEDMALALAERGGTVEDAALSVIQRRMDELDGKIDAERAEDGPPVRAESVAAADVPRRGGEAARPLPVDRTQGRGERRAGDAGGAGTAAQRADAGDQTLAEVPTRTRESQDTPLVNVSERAQADMFDDVADGQADAAHAVMMEDLRAAAEDMPELTMDLGAGNRTLTEILDDLEADEDMATLAEACK